jgi:16S rRNA (cytosine1402-N4)-methyltransferase
MELPESGHEPVLMRPVMELLSPLPGQTVVDCTLGRGGHSLEIGARLGETGTLVGIDADPRNLRYAAARLEGLACRKRLFNANFAQLPQVLSEARISQVDGILADLGVSTNQLFDPHYGLSFAADGPLDMRLDPQAGRSAGDLVNTMREEDLANVLYELAQERYSRRIARKIVEARRISPIKTTGRLAEIVRSAVPRPSFKDRIDPATRTFLALRMAVNQEMENLQKLLTAGVSLLRVGGRMLVISFQSMEDRLVKQVFRSLEQVGQIKSLTRKPVGPDEDEVLNNPRSRSAKLRAVERVQMRK